MSWVNPPPSNGYHEGFIVVILRPYYIHISVPVLHEGGSDLRLEAFMGGFGSIGLGDSLGIGVYGLRL